MNGGNSGDSREPVSSASLDDPDETGGGVLSTRVVEETSGFGLSMTVLTGVLLAFAYYGIIGMTELGFGQAIPPPFYLLALALVFVVELSRSRSFDARGLAHTVAITAVYGTLVILAVEGGAYLWAHPEAALDEFAGVAVLAVSLVVSALAYVGYLTAVESSR